MQVGVAVVLKVMQRLLDVNAPGVFGDLQQQPTEVVELRGLHSTAGHSMTQHHDILQNNGARRTTAADNAYG